MLTKKMTILLAMTAVLTIGAALADDCDDFSQTDYNRVLQGGKDFIGAKLEGANFMGLNLCGRNFNGADLEGANLQNADLRNANFKDADLESANLKGANISGAIFSEAELEFATWTDGRVCAEGSIGGCW